MYVKLPMFMFFSVRESKYRKWLETSRIKKSGVLRPRTYTLPKYMLGFILERSDKLGELYEAMSPKSKAIADKALHAVIEKHPRQGC